MLNTFEILNKLNVSPSLSEEKKKKIVDLVLTEFKIDDASREGWLTNYEDWMKLAMQTHEVKNTPWPNAANVKYPLLTIASIQFSARAYSLLIGTRNKLVKSNYFGYDATGEKKKACDRVSRHMSYQLRYKNTTWTSDMDKGLLILPIIGCFFKKTYWDSDKGSFCSDLVLPRVLVVNWNTPSLEKADRISHILYKSKNDIVSHILKEEYEDVYEKENNDYKIENNRFHISSQESNYIRDTTEQVTEDNSGWKEDSSRPITLIEQHRRLDLDEDGYAEPYIVTVDKDNEKLLRIVPNFNTSTIKQTKEGKIYKIDALEYFTKYSFIPNPDGGFYDIGFGMLLGSINRTVNTLINQLLDSGTLNNTSSGFISKNLNIKGGSFSFGPGKWNFINSTYDDLRKAILPMPTKEPSMVLLHLLELLISICRDMTTIQDINVGKTPGQNTPATTTMAAVEEGKKLFNSIYERIHGSLDKELSLMYALNRDYLEGSEEFFDLDYKEENNMQDASVVTSDDYKTFNMKITPTADPNASSEMQRQANAEKIISLVGTGKINPDEAIKNQLEVLGIDDWQRFINTQPPQPPIDLIKHQDEMRIEQEKLKLENRKVALLEKESPSKIQEIVSKTILNMKKGDGEDIKLSLEEEKQALALLDRVMEHSNKQEDNDFREKELEKYSEIEKQKGVNNE